jgi:hypothetical protein
MTALPGPSVMDLHATYGCVVEEVRRELASASRSLRECGEWG